MQHNGIAGRSGMVWHRSDVSDSVANPGIGLSLRVTNVWMEKWPKLNISKRGWGELQTIHLHNRRLFHSF